MYANEEDIIDGNANATMRDRDVGHAGGIGMKHGIRNDSFFFLCGIRERQRGKPRNTDRPFIFLFT